MKALFKKRKKTLLDILYKNHSTQDSRVVPHRGTNWAALWLTAQIGRDAVLSKSYGRGYLTLPTLEFMGHFWDPSQCSLVELSHLIQFFCAECKGHGMEPALNNIQHKKIERKKKKKERKFNIVEQIFRTRA